VSYVPNLLSGQPQTHPQAQDGGVVSIVRTDTCSIYAMWLRNSPQKSLAVIRRLAGRVFRQMPRRKPTQFLLDQRQQLVGRLAFVSLQRG
jgi:hypothetical protein